jgi:hypothetical protein
LLDCARNFLKWAPKSDLEPSNNRGNRTALDQDRKEQSLDWIQQNAENNTPIAKEEIKHYQRSQFQPPIN